MNKNNSFNELFFQGVISEDSYKEDGYVIFNVELPPDGFIKVISQNSSCLELKKGNVVIIQGPFAYIEDEGIVCSVRTVTVVNQYNANIPSVSENSSNEKEMVKPVSVEEKDIENTKVEVIKSNVEEKPKNVVEKSDDLEYINYESMYSEQNSNEILIDDGCYIMDDEVEDIKPTITNNSTPVIPTKSENKKEEVPNLNPVLRPATAFNEYGLPLPNSISIFSKPQENNNSTSVSNNKVHTKVQKEEAKSLIKNKTKETNVSADGKRKFTLDDLM